MNNQRKIKDLKIKLANLNLEIQSLLQGAEFEPGMIDAVYQDITNFTEELRQTGKQLLNLKNKPKNEALSLMNVYENMVKEGFQGDGNNEFENNNIIINEEYKKWYLEGFRDAKLGKKSKFSSHEFNSTPIT